MCIRRGVRNFRFRPESRNDKLWSRPAARGSPRRAEAGALSAYPVYGDMLLAGRKQLKGGMLALLLHGRALPAGPAYGCGDVPAVDLGVELAAMEGGFPLEVVARALRVTPVAVRHIAGGPPQPFLVDGP